MGNLGTQPDGLGWPPVSECSADKDVSPSSWLNTFGPSPSPSLSYQFCSAPAHPQRRPLCFFIYLTTRLKSFISLLGNSSSLRFFFFLFSICQTSPRLALNYSLSVSSPSCAAALYLTPLFCHPYPWPLTPLLIFLICLIRQESASPQPFHAARSVFPRCRLSGGAFH